MNSLSCLIIEDSESDARLLTGMLDQLSIFQKIDETQRATEALDQLITFPYDLIFLDIRLPDLPGMDFLRYTPHRPPTIVTTAFLDYAVLCYDLQVADFLLKPFELSRLQRAINRALKSTHEESIKPQTTSIFLQANRQMKQFHFLDIDFIEAHGAYSKIHTTGGVNIVNHAISWIEAKLPLFQFIRIQKSFIVNLSHITAVESRSVWINTTKITVGSQYISQLRQLVKN